MKTNKQILVLAKMFTLLFAPHYFTLLCLLVLMGFSYMRIFPLNYKIFLLAIVYIFTIAAPTPIISLQNKVTGITRHQMSQREMRTMPYIISILCYYICYQMLTSLAVPHFVVSVVLASLFVQMACALVNCWYKVSTHSAAAGAINGALIAFSFVFNFNPIWWLCATLIIAGCVGSSRLILRRHTLAEVNTGIFLGFIVGLLSILLT
jgi:hypothetical protein